MITGILGQFKNSNQTMSRKGHSGEYKDDTPEKDEWRFRGV